MAAPLLADETDLREAIEKEKRDKTAMALAAEAAGKMPVHALAAEPVTGGPYDAMQA